VLNRLAAALSQRVSAETYDGARALLLPLDFGLSLLAKRAYPLYRAWEHYRVATKPFFDGGDEARDPALGPAEQAALEELLRVGAAVTEAPFCAAEIDEARDWVIARTPPAKAHARSLDPEGECVHVQWTADGIQHEYVRTTGRTRFYFTAERLRSSDLPRAICAFPELPGLKAIARAYLGSSTLLAGSPYYMAEIVEPAPRVESWHVDCIRPTVKAFLTLTDVGPEHAPLRVIPGSHLVDEERHRLFFRICQSGLGVAYFDEEACARFDRAARVVTAPRNRILIFDNRAIHAGSRALRADEPRIVLAVGFRPPSSTRVNPRMFRDPEPAPYPAIAM
jgi:hypothetical protein